MVDILITGAAGFIGSHFANLVQKEHPDWRIFMVDALKTGGRLTNISGVDGSITLETIGAFAEAPRVSNPGFDYVVNFAAETHVDRSISGPLAFIDSNYSQMAKLLEAVRLSNKRCRFCQVSTDEVYGDLQPEEPPFTESSPIKPSSPYSASKAAADMLALAYHRTYGMDVVVTRCGNNYGPRQFSEKLIPFMVKKGMSGEDYPVYGTGNNVRDWIYVEDHCRAILLVLEKGVSGEVYNIGSGCERTNNEIVGLVAQHFQDSKGKIVYVQDRLGHDWRYALDTTKIRETLGFVPATSFEDGLRETLDWYCADPGWLWEKCS